MDSRSHVDFALKLLPTNLHTGVCAALFPQIDRQPATLHRNFAHHLNKTDALVDKGLNIVLQDHDPDPSDYASRRFGEERQRILAYLPEAPKLSEISSDVRAAAQMAFVSHLYLDTFNQPVQAFTPFRSNVSGQFALWNRIGDFRYRLYVDGVVEELRKDWLKSAIWTHEFSPIEMTEAMVFRLADLGDVDPKSDILAKAFESLRIAPNADDVRAQNWLKEMEFELCNLHIRYLG